MAEHGAYLLLLIHCWDTREPIPLDEREAAGICNARSGDELEAMRRVLRRYFVQMDDGWYNRRLQREIARCEAISTVRGNAGRQGANARMRRLREAKQMVSKSLANAQQVTLSPSLSLRDTSPLLGRGGAGGEKRGSRLPPDWRPAPALMSWAKVSRPDLDLDDALAQFLDYWTAKPGQAGLKLDWEATFRNWVRRQQPTARASGSSWWQSEKATEEMAKQVGCWPPRPGESWPELRERIRAARVK